MKQQIINNILLTVIILSSISLGLTLHLVMEDLIDDGLFSDSYSKVNGSINCSNLTLEDTAYCLRENVKQIYKYNVTDDRKTLSYEELVEFGGDCKNWAEYYESIVPEGFYTSMPVFDYAKKKGHKILIISNDEGYCILDQVTTPKCNGFRSLNNSTKEE